MANGVFVESAAIQGGIGCCKTSIHELESASKSLQRAYQQAGSGGWKVTVKFRNALPREEKSATL